MTEQKKTVEIGDLGRVITEIFSKLSPGPWTFSKNEDWNPDAQTPVEQCKACGEWPLTPGHILMGRKQLKRVAIAVAKGKDATDVPALGSLFKVEGANEADVHFVINARRFLKVAIRNIEQFMEKDQKRQRAYDEFTSRCDALREAMEKGEQENQLLRTRIEQAQRAVREAQQAMERDDRLTLKQAQKVCSAIIGRAVSVAKDAELQRRIRRACEPLVPDRKVKTV